MNILSIGNSFSQDAQRYLHQIAKADCEDIHCFNLYIGGCPLSFHHSNIHSEERNYTLEMNGSSTGFNVSLTEALLNRDWDVITLQQVSTQSPNYKAYQPYLDGLVEYIRQLVPKAKLAVHQTWAYEQGSVRLHEELGYGDYKQMLFDIIKAYQTAAEHIGADYIIPSGEVFGAMLENGIEKIHRDTFHASLGLGRYALGLIWYKILTGNDVLENTFCDFDEEVSAEQIAIAKKCVNEVANRYGA
ncbi:MAG: DUF4886 domain-containing protein [Oscillospiraceae bacterium]|nr:DUF4886 domain-containing protein [Oscillospiraceae bacterium]